MVPKEDAEDPETEQILDVIQNHKYVVSRACNLVFCSSPTRLPWIRRPSLP